MITLLRLLILITSLPLPRLLVVLAVLMVTVLGSYLPRTGPMFDTLYGMEEGNRCGTPTGGP